jgi:hypothetical protein
MSNQIRYCMSSYLQDDNADDKDKDKESGDE